MEYSASGRRRAAAPGGTMGPMRQLATTLSVREAVLPL